MSWIWTKHIWSRWVTPHWLYGGGCAIYYSSYSSLFYSLILLHVVNTSPTDTVDHPPCPQTFHIKVNFWTCTDDQAVREWGLVSADPWDEDYCCTWWKGAADIANKGSQSGNAQDLCLGLLPPNPPLLLPYPNMTASLLRAKVWGQFFCNQYTDRTFSSAHVYGNDHLWWVVTAVSAWCWTLIGCICCQEVWGPFDLARLPRS